MADWISAFWADRPPALPVLANRDWEAFLSQARRTGLLPRLALRFAQHGWMAHIPPRVADYLESSLRLVERQRDEVRWELDQIRKAVAALDIPVVVLKGAAYLCAELPPAQGRVFSDIDLLVDRQHLAALESALFAAGWMSDERDAYNQRYYRRWMHEIPPMRHVTRGSVIDLHHTIAPPTSRFKVDGRLLLQKAQPTKIPGFWVLAPEDMILHSAAHLYQEGEFERGLRDLLDMHGLVGHFSSAPDFWPALLARAQELGLLEPLTFALDHLQRLFGLRLPVALRGQLETLRPNRLTGPLLNALWTLALRPHHPDCDSYFSGFARWALYVRSHHIRMPIYLLVPHLIRKAYMTRFPPLALEKPQ